MSQELKPIRDSCLTDLKKGQRRDESATSLATVRFSDDLKHGGHLSIQLFVSN